MLLLLLLLLLLQVRARVEQALSEEYEKELWIRQMRAQVLEHSERVLEGKRQDTTTMANTKQHQQLNG